MTQSRATLRAKIPEIEQSMKVINHLETKKEEGESVITHFELSDTIYATAEIKDPQSVCLWLGVNRKKINFILKTSFNSLFFLFPKGKCDGGIFF